MAGYRLSSTVHRPSSVTKPCDAGLTIPVIINDVRGNQAGCPAFSHNPRITFTHHGETTLSDMAQAHSRTYIETLVLALGGNAIQRSGERGTAEEQFANVSKAMTS